MQALDEIKAVLRSESNNLRALFGISGVSVFGSVARGDDSAESDVDILASFERDISLLKLVSAENYISECLKRKVDLIPEKNIRTELRDRILKEAVPV